MAPGADSGAPRRMFSIALFEAFAVSNTFGAAGVRPAIISAIASSPGFASGLRWSGFGRVKIGKFGTGECGLVIKTG